MMTKGESLPSYVSPWLAKRGTFSWAPWLSPVIVFEFGGLKFDTELIRISNVIFVSLVVKSKVEWNAKPLKP
jgi:hypothetical protein